MTGGDARGNDVLAGKTVLSWLLLAVNDVKRDEAVGTLFLTDTRGCFMIVRRRAESEVAAVGMGKSDNAGNAGNEEVNTKLTSSATVAHGILLVLCIGAVARCNSILG